jgi:hypothetical protein
MFDLPFDIALLVITSIQRYMHLDDEVADNF